MPYLFDAMAKAMYWHEQVRLFSILLRGLNIRPNQNQVKGV